MDYLKGSLVIDRESAIGAMLKHLGNLQRGNALLQPSNLWDSVMDAEFYALRLDPFKEFVDQYAKPRLYKKNVNDCDNMTMKGICDLSDAAQELGWECNPSMFALAYNSNTLGDKTSRLGGYHLAGLALTWNPEVKDLLPMIVQWPYLSSHDETTEYPAQWQDPALEMGFWTGAFGL